MYASLESPTQVIHESRADDGGSQSEQSGMNIEAALEANPELAETIKPGMCALDDPTMTPEPLTAFDTTASYLAHRLLSGSLKFVSVGE